MSITDWTIVADPDGSAWAVASDGHWWPLDQAIRVCEQLMEKYREADDCSGYGAARDYLRLNQQLIAAIEGNE